MGKKLCLYDFVFVLKSKTHHIKKKILGFLKKETKKPKKMYNIQVFW